MHRHQPSGLSPDYCDDGHCYHHNDDLYHHDQGFVGEDSGAQDDNVVLNFGILIILIEMNRDCQDDFTLNWLQMPLIKMTLPQHRLIIIVMMIIVIIKFTSTSSTLVQRSL